jgi:hypothetical protein
LRPDIIQGNGRGPAAGIAQWENYNTKKGRWLTLSNYAKSKGKSWDDLGIQLEFIDKELRGLGKAFWRGSAPGMQKAQATGTDFNSWKNSKDVEMATRQFEGAFERAGKPHLDKRISAAKSFYNKNNTILNGLIKSFPSSFVCMINGVKVQPYYEGKEIFNEIDDGIKI